MNSAVARVLAVFGNMVTAELDQDVKQNAVAYCCRGDGRRLLSEVIRIRGRLADLQVFEETRGLRVGDQVEFTDEMLSVVLAPGLLGQVFDGLQNPLHKVAEQIGYFLTPGVYIPCLRRVPPASIFFYLGEFLRRRPVLQISIFHIQLYMLGYFRFLFPYPCK